MSQSRCSTPVIPANATVANSQPARIVSQYHPRTSHPTKTLGNAVGVGSHFCCCPRSTMGTSTSSACQPTANAVVDRRLEECHPHATPRRIRGGSKRILPRVSPAPSTFETRILRCTSAVSPITARCALASGIGFVHPPLRAERLIASGHVDAPSRPAHPHGSCLRGDTGGVAARTVRACSRQAIPRPTRYADRSHHLRAVSIASFGKRRIRQSLNRHDV
jgi:hypothetical protein